MTERGRPTDYDPEYVRQVERLCDLGATDDEIAEFFGVSVRTIHRWKIDHPDFCHAMKIGKSAADDRVERSLYNMAQGYAYVEQVVVKVRDSEGGESVEVVDVQKFQPADKTAAIFWAKNRRRKQWSETMNVNVRFEDMTDEQIEAELNRIANKGKGG
jgi:hypothetical protein